MEKRTLFKTAGITDLFQQNGGTLAHRQSFLVSINWRHIFTSSVILRFNKTGAHLHAITNSTFQQNGGTTAHSQ